jgi:Fe2+ transport system protein FeoA
MIGAAVDGARCTLARLRPGQRGRIHRVAGEGSGLYQRLLEIGLLDGVEVEMIRSAPLGDPLQIRIRGAFYSLRKSEAAHVHVEVAP